MTMYRKLDIPALFISHYQDMRGFDRAFLSELENWERNLEAILERGISFADNIDVRSVSFTSDATPDAENTVAHTLGKIPTGYIVIKQDKAGSLYDSGTTWTNSNIYLKCDVASVTFTIFVF